MPNINDKAHCKQHAVLMGQDRHQRISRVCRQDLTGSKHCRDACIADPSVEAAIKEDGGGLQAAVDDGLRLSGMQAVQRGGRLGGDPGARRPVQPHRPSRPRRPPPVQRIVYAPILCSSTIKLVVASIDSIELQFPAGLEVAVL